MSCCGQKSKTSSKKVNAAQPPPAQKNSIDKKIANQIALQDRMIVKDARKRIVTPFLIQNQIR